MAKFGLSKRYFSLFIVGIVAIFVTTLAFLIVRPTEHYYLVQMLKSPSATMILDERGELVKRFDDFYIAFDKKFGIAMVSGSNYLRYFDVNGKLRFEKQLEKFVHHSIVLHPETGELYVINNDVRDYHGQKAVIDSIERFSLSGERLSGFYIEDYHDKLFELFSPFVSRQFVEKGYFPLNPDGVRPSGKLSQLFHFNYLQVIPENANAGVVKGFEPGNILLSFAYYGAFITLDPKTFEILWSKSFFLDHLDLVNKSWLASVDQSPTGILNHSPNVNEDGNVTYYQNCDFQKQMVCRLGPTNKETCSPKSEDNCKASIIRLDPNSGKKIFNFEDTNDPSITSRVQGSAFLLDNGNYLVTNSGEGVFYEMTEDGDVVFSYDVKTRGHHAGKRIYQVRKMPAEFIDPFLNLLL